MLWARRPCCEAEISFSDCAAVDEGSGRSRRDVRPRRIGVRRRVDLGQGHRRLIRCRSGGGEFLCEATRCRVLGGKAGASAGFGGGSLRLVHGTVRLRRPGCPANVVLEAAGVDDRVPPGTTLHGLRHVYASLVFKYRES